MNATIQNYRVLTMAYDSLTTFFLGLSPSSNFAEQQDVSESGSASAFGQKKHVTWWTPYIELVSVTGPRPIHQVGCFFCLKTEAHQASETSCCFKNQTMNKVQKRTPCQWINAIIIIMHSIDSAFPTGKNSTGSDVVNMEGTISYCHHRHPLNSIQNYFLLLQRLAGEKRRGGGGSGGCLVIRQVIKNCVIMCV